MESQATYIDLDDEQREALRVKMRAKEFEIEAHNAAMRAKMRKEAEGERNLLGGEPITQLRGNRHQRRAQKVKIKAYLKSIA